MIFWILLVSIFVTIGYFQYYNWNTGWDWMEAFEIVMGSSVVGGLLLALITIFLSILIDNGAIRISDDLVINPIVSLRTTESIEGKFFLGCGYINGSEKFFFTYSYGDDRYERGSIYSNGTLLVESNESLPNLSYHHVKSTNPKGHWFIPQCWVMEHEWNERYTLTIPKGTIVQRFEVK